MGALNGLKILDFTTLLPGPFATLMLADLGAEVVSVCRPDGQDMIASWPPEIPGTGTTGVQAWLGRNKRRIALDLKSKEAVSLIRKMVEEYDIVIESFRPGVMRRLGLDYESLRECNPRLIYCSLTGYGQSGPRKDRAGHDCNYLARSGILASAGKRDSGPSLYNFQIAGVAAGSNNAVIGILAAVYYREKTGEGQYLDISIQDGLVPFHTMDGAAYLVGGCLPERESGRVNGGSIYDFYETADGGYMSVGSLEPKFFAQLCEALELPEWSDGKKLTEEPERVKEEFRRRFKGKTRAEWTEIFEKYDACVEPVQTLKEAVEDEQLIARGMWSEVPLFAGEEQLTKSVMTVMQPGCPIHMSKTPPEYRHAGSPAE